MKTRISYSNPGTWTYTETKRVPLTGITVRLRRRGFRLWRFRLTITRTRRYYPALDSAQRAVEVSLWLKESYKKAGDR